ncbi:MAG: FecR domain-containing protein [Rhodocyclaceae bacterium]|nr:FecR domain-containing protein [Rhodocyclaceae bacterium]
MSTNPPALDRFDPILADEAGEAREFEAFAQGQDPLDLAAAAWVARRRNGLDARGEAGLQAWLHADPRHAAAFADMDDTFAQLRRLPDDEVSSLKTGLSAPDQAMPAGAVRNPALAAPAAPRRRPVDAGWRRWLSGLAPLSPRAAVAALVCLAVGGGWLGWECWRQLPTFEQTYATERGQQVAVSLPDGGAASQPGSTLQLDTATRIDARLYRDRREVRLVNGQAMFAVRSDAARPFHVRAGGLSITVVGTRFSVRHAASGLAAGQTVIAVEEGRVRVARAGRGESDGGPAGPAADAPIELTAGQSVTAGDDGRIGPVTRVSPAAIALWRDGRISFDRTPLAQAVAEFERYGATGLTIRDPAVAAMPVGGSYDVRQFRRFAETLPRLLPVRLVRRGDVTEIVAR